MGLVVGLGGRRGGVAAMGGSMRRFLFTLLALATVLWPGIVAAQPVEKPGAPPDYRESAAVLAHYSAVPDVRLDSPAFLAPEPTLTSQKTMLAFLKTLVRDSRRIHMGSMGQSQQGREIPILYLTAEGLADPVAIARLGRPVVWLIGQQHGNEPAGGEAMLALAAALARGDLAPLLSKVSVVIVPRANPDGAAADRRVLASGADPNRDHLLLSQPETRALHRAMQALPPDVVFDHHEFSVAWRWLEKFGALQRPDVMILEATNPLISRALTAIERGLYRPALETAITANGLMPHDYVTTSADTSDRRVLLGGTAPGIARNTFGLRGSVSYLIETRGVGIGLQSYQRRVATHYLLAKAVLQTTAADPQGLLKRLAEARQAAASDRGALVVSHTEGEREIQLPLIDPRKGTVRLTRVTLVDSRDIHPLDVRPRPRGYLVLRGGGAVADRLALNEAWSCTVAAATSLAVEAYDVTRNATASNREAINPDQSMHVRVEAKTIDVPAGALFVPMTQPASGIIASALEPDSPGSYLGVGVIPMSADRTEAPVYRVMSGTALSLKPRPGASEALCSGG
ncbi:MAG: M14 family metallocarboxypeptidase [Proteobacteria bacterium]|nr:M14 family metallocarboxypeptidase [Pseudomonadota bacterium]